MRPNEKGFSAMLALGIIAVVFLLILAGLLMVNLAGKLITRQLRYAGQAQNAAEAGMVDALNFFRRNATQPVINFDPQLNLGANPPVDDSAFPAIGIVRDFRVSDLGNICGRYEVRRQDLNDDGTIQTSEEGRGVQDITNNKGRTAAGAGNVWLLESQGFIYVDSIDSDSDPDTCDLTFTDSNTNGVWDFGERGEVLIRRILRTQIQRMSMVLPGGNAAINAADLALVDIGDGGDKGRVLGGPSGIGIAYAAGTGPATITGDVQGTPATNPVNPYNDSFLDVFGVTQSELIASADASPTSVAGLPPSWAMKLYVVENDATFTTLQPLMGSGVLVVIGDLFIPAGSNYQGLIYVTGDYTQEGPSLVSGSVIAKGAVTLSGAGDFAEVDYDNNIIIQVQAEMIQYRFGRNPYIYAAN
ncbi:MAG TPA: hypothetical protein VLH08_00445 [Acidobacteriota bacterium]|nr:hypothetical protein [Acidobacteriota bacterium]